MSCSMFSLESISEFVRNEASIKQRKDDGSLPITRIETIAEREVNLEKCGYADVNDTDYRLSNGDILISHINSEKYLGKCAIYEHSRGDVIHGMKLFCLGPNSELVFPRYLFHYLSSPMFGWLFPAITKKSVNQASFTVTAFKELLIPLPPLVEQKRIATILDKADAIRRKSQQTIQLVDEFFRSVILDMFSDPVTNPKVWDEIVLKDITDIRTGVTKGKKFEPSTAITLPYMRVANDQDGYLSLDDIQEITVSPKDAEKCKLRAGDILLTEGGDPDKLGRGHVWNDEVPNCIHQNHIFSVRIKDQSLVRPEFLSTQIAFQRGKRYFLKVGKKTTGIATINKTVLSEFEPLVPPVEIQDRYIRIETFIRKLKEKSFMENVGFFQSLSQKAFSGDL